MNRFTVNYYAKGKLSHSYEERWERTVYFCPNCGKQAVWHEMGEGDYYVGEQFLCSGCGGSFHMPHGPEPRPNDEQDKQRLVAIRAFAATQEIASTTAPHCSYLEGPCTAPTACADNGFCMANPPSFSQEPPK